jgi:uncharacterized protein YfaS (alpha-2-macroglobulin family)
VAEASAPWRRLGAATTTASREIDGEQGESSAGEVGRQRWEQGETPRKKLKQSRGRATVEEGATRQRNPGKGKLPWRGAGRSRIRDGAQAARAHREKKKKKPEARAQGRHGSLTRELRERDGDGLGTAPGSCAARRVRSRAEKKLHKQGDWHGREEERRVAGRAQRNVEQSGHQMNWSASRLKKRTLHVDKDQGGQEIEDRTARVEGDKADGEEKYQATINDGWKIFIRRDILRKKGEIATGGGKISTR